MPRRSPPAHLRRGVFVYVRQSTQSQLERNPESRERQYGLVGRALELGWNEEQGGRGRRGSRGLGVGPGAALRLRPDDCGGGLGKVGLIWCLEVPGWPATRRNWYRLLRSVRGHRHTLIGDTDGIYHPGGFKRSPRARPQGGPCRKPSYTCCGAALRVGSATRPPKVSCAGGLPVRPPSTARRTARCSGHPDEAVTGAIRSVFARFAPARLGTSGLAVVLLRGPLIPASVQPPGPPSPGSGPPTRQSTMVPHKSGIRWGLRLRPDQAGALRGRSGPARQRIPGRSPRRNGGCSSRVITPGFIDSGQPTRPTAQRIDANIRPRAQ